MNFFIQNERIYATGVTLTKGETIVKYSKHKGGDWHTYEGEIDLPEVHEFQTNLGRYWNTELNTWRPVNTGKSPNSEVFVTCKVISKVRIKDRFGIWTYYFQDGPMCGAVLSEEAFNKDFKILTAPSQYRNVVRPTEEQE